MTTEIRDNHVREFKALIDIIESVDDTAEVIVFIDGYYRNDKQEFTGYMCRLKDEIDWDDDDLYFYYFDGIECLLYATETDSILSEFVVTNFEFAIKNK